MTAAEAMTVGMTSRDHKPPLAPPRGERKPTALLPALGRGGAGGGVSIFSRPAGIILTPPLPLPYKGGELLRMKGGERLPDEYVLHLK